MRISKKILAAVLAALMVIAMMPFTAFADYSIEGPTVEYDDITVAAYSEDDEGFDLFSGDYCYEWLVDENKFNHVCWRLTEDIVTTGPIVIPAGADMQIDLNGHTLSGYVADEDGKKLIQVYGKLEFVGENGGCIYNTNTAGQGHAACQALTGGTVVVSAPITFGDSDEIRDNANNTNRGCGIQNNGGTLIINDGYYTSIDANYTTGAWAYAILNCAGDTIVNNATVYGNGLHGALGCEEGTFTVNGGTFAVNGANNYYSLYADGGDFIVNGGTFTDNSKYGVNYVGDDSETTISGGTFTYSSTTPFVQKGSTSNPVVTGGTFSGDVTAYLADGCFQTNGTVNYTPVKNGDNYYTTLADALAAAEDGDTIELFADLEGEGIVVAKNKFATGVTVDFGGHTYTVASTVGSTGTVTNGFQLNEGNTITFENGTITSTVCKILIQNYSNLTVDNMTLTNANDATGQYTLSNNFGNVVITDSVINASAKKGSFAYDISTGWSKTYTDVSVTMNGSTVINGDIEIGSYANYPGNGVITLNLTNGTINGNLVASSYNTSWQKVSDEIGENITVQKSEDCKYAPPVGYVWENNVLVESNAADTMSITANDNVDLNLYIDATETATAQFKITYSDPTSEDEDATVTKTQDATGSSTDTVKVELAPAQINDTIKVEVLDDNGDVQRVIETSVADYCNTIIATVAEDPSAFGDKSAELAELAKSTLDYGKAAAEYFGYNEDKFDAGNKLDAPNLDAITYEGSNHNYSGLTITNVSYVATTVPELRFYVTGYSSEYDLERMNANLSVNFEGATAKFVKVDNKNVALSVKGVDITKFGTQLVVSNGTTPILYFVPITWAKAAAAQTTDEELQALGNAICNYYLMSVAYFG